MHHANYIKEKASAAKTPVEILIVRNAGHNWREVNAPIQPSIDDIAARTAAFMKQHLDISPRK